MIVAIDPGSTGTGFAVFTHEPVPIAESLVRAGLVYPPNKLSFIDNSRYITDVVMERLKGEVPITHMYIEWPQYFGETARGHTANSQGDLFKLSFFIGMLTISAQKAGMSVEMIQVDTWKGQLPKKEVERRVVELFGRKKCDELGVKLHAVDAVGIGLHAKGYRFSNAAYTR